MYISDILNEMPTSYTSDLEKKVYEKLNELSINFDRVDNDTVESMEECLEIDKKLGAEIRKTIIVCNDKKTQFYLVVLPAEKRFDSKAFRDKMECSRVSFARAEDMQEILGVVPGSATVMSVVNDNDDKVKVVIDKEVADAEYFACNTGENTRHIKIKTSDLLEKYLPSVNHDPKIIEL
ncbi:MAG: prolyl-tRNA synthetase associated domain-containing protein [Bacilli bacterium]|nr:prolyl-tRNA synthetase associated domain-containing protein [Bacilli bacterium]